MDIQDEMFVYEYRNIWFLFVFAQVTYFSAWSTILCQVVSGMVREPDEMPIPVWIATIGLLTLYQTFISAQANAIYLRCKNYLCYRHNITGECAKIAMTSCSPVATMFYSFLQFGDWENIVLIAMSISSDLISGVLYSIPWFRKEFKIPEDSSASEAWCILTFVYVSSILVLLLNSAYKKLLTCNSTITLVTDVCSQSYALKMVSIFVLYMAWSVGWFLFWGYFVMRKLDKSVATYWMIAAFGLPLCTTIFCIMKSCFKGYEPAGVATTRSTAPKDENYLVMGFVNSPLRKAHDGIENDVLHAFAEDHRSAAIAHFVVILVICMTIILVNKVDVNSSYDTYSFWLDRKKGMSNKLDTSFNKFDYCLRPNSLPIMRWWCAIGWCFTSFVYHTMSALTLWSYKSGTGCAQWLSDNKGEAMCVVTIAMSVLISLAVEHRDSPSTIVLIPMLSCIGSAIVFVLWGTISVKCNNKSSYMLHLVSHNKWVEYSISATLMHVVVNCMAGVVNAHELVLLCGYLVVSMILVQLIENSMARIERCHTEPEDLLQVHVDSERPFIALSFFAKLTLTVTLCAPLAMQGPENRFEVNTEPLKCSVLEKVLY
jgi:hypothetical protein